MKSKLAVSSYFLYWLVIFSLVCVGSFLAYVIGFVDVLNKADVTKISFLIYGLLIIFSLRLGLHNYRFDRCKDKNSVCIESFLRKQEITWFVADILLTLGMLGTVLGFIYMLHANFANIDVSKVEAMRETLKTMGTGMSTALYTTAAGLVGSLLLKIQLFNFNKQLEDRLKGCDV